jgi:hypothetical protein
VNFVSTKLRHVCETGSLNIGLQAQFGKTLGWKQIRRGRVRRLWHTNGKTTKVTNRMNNGNSSYVHAYKLLEFRCQDVYLYVIRFCARFFFI